MQINEIMWASVAFPHYFVNLHYRSLQIVYANISYPFC